MIGIILIWFIALFAGLVFSFVKESWLGGIISAALLIVSAFFFIFFKPWAFVDNYELGYKFNMTSGQITVLDRPGYHFITPIIESVHTIDTRPRQVCINAGGGTQNTSSVNQRVLNCKLVQFNRAGLELFIQWHGRDDYSGPVFDDLLKIYAYDGSGKNYPFLNVLRELKAGDNYVPEVTPTATPGK